MDVFCIGLVFSRSQYRYQTYAHQYVEALLRLHKVIALFSPDWIELNNYFQVHFRDQIKKIHCFPISETFEGETDVSGSEMLKKYLKLGNQLKKAERNMQTKIDLVFFAPANDWIKPDFRRKIMDWTFPFKWSGIFTHLPAFEYQGLKLNTDPKLGDPDYPFTAKGCIGVCTLDRFSTEELKSRVYKRVVVLPDVSDLNLPEKPQRISSQIRKMAKGRMVIGTMLLENENPENFLELAHYAPADQYFFVCAGPLEPESMSEKAREELKQILSSGRNNNYFILNQPGESEHINDLLLTFDVCYLNEGNFQLPHPLLTKAAFFNKPVIASKNDMIGRLVNAFKTGITVNGKIEESLSAINTLRLQAPFDIHMDMGKLNNYAQLQNQEALREAWEMLLLF